MIAQTLLRRFAAAEAAAPDASTDRRWHWRRGTVMFPEAKCPFCGETMKSNRIWLIEGQYTLRGQLAFKQESISYTTKDGKTRRRKGKMRLVFERPNHPHVDEGSICLGDTEDPVAALFLGLNPDSAFFGGERRRWNPWLKEMFDHTCPPPYRS